MVPDTKWLHEGNLSAFKTFPGRAKDYYYLFIYIIIINKTCLIIFGSPTIVLMCECSILYPL